MPLLGACQAQPFGDASGKASRTVSAFFHGQGPKKTPCFFFFFREAWEIIFFGGRCQVLKMNNLRGKKVISKDDSK